MLYVTKFNGSRRPFQKGKIVNTCLRMHASVEQAHDIANRIEKEAFDGIPTKEVIRLVFKYLSEYRSEIRYLIDLRTAISLLRPKPDFEYFIGEILKELGYKIEMNKTLKGRCVEHEVDVIAKNENKTVLVEVKHHINPHIFIGLDTFLEYWATFEDLTGSKERHHYNFNSLLIVCNTKISDHAKKYAACKNINYLAWKSPENSLEKIIDAHKLYPITMIKGLDTGTLERLGNSNIVLLKQLVECDLNQLERLTKIKKEKLKALADVAKKILLL